LITIHCNAELNATFFHNWALLSSPNKANSTATGMCTRAVAGPRITTELTTTSRVAYWPTHDDSWIFYTFTRGDSLPVS